MNLVAERLAAARQELLDLGLRNPLLNFRPLKSRGLTIIAEQPPQVFDLLVRQRQTMSFLPLAEVESQDIPADWLPQPDESHLPPDRHSDHRLQTPYSSPVLQERLLNTELSARTIVDEQGVNVLHLALGLLRWRETATAETIRLAPLILVPVQLEREDAAAPFCLRYTDADISENASLRFKFQVDFGLNLPPFPEPDELDVMGYLDSVAAALPTHFSVDKDAIHLGFFSFTRLTLYHDLTSLNGSTTPPENHPLLQTILGEPGMTDLFTHHAPRTTSLDPLLHHPVLDSDSSQAQAIHAVSQGQNLIIQGPPGTGKSQTITNLIAEAVGEGKTVLFVAEKLAALEVVKRRLDAVGLGDACLELHSHKTSRTSFLAELGRTLSLGEPKETGHFAQRDQWENTRDRLNTYHQAINTPIGESGVTPYQVVGKLVGNSGELVGTQRNSGELRGTQKSLADSEQSTVNSEQLAVNSLHSPVSNLSISQSLNLSALAELTAREYTDLRAWVLTLQTHLQQMGVPVQHPFWGSGRVNVGANEVEQVRRSAGQALAALQAWQAAAATLAHALHLTLPAGPTQLQQLLAAADLLQQAPHLYAVRADHPAWHSESQRILAGLNAAISIAHRHRQYDDLLIPEAWSQPVISIRQALAAGQGRWGQWFSRDYRRGRAQLAGLCQKPVPGNWAAQMAVVDAILEVQRQQPILADVEPLLMELFTVRWQGLRSDWASLNQIAYWLTHLHQEIHEERIPAGMLAYLNHTIPDKKPLLEAVHTVHTTATAYQQTIHPLLHLLEPTTEFLEFPPVPTSSPAPFTTIQARLHAWLTSAQRWVEMGRWLELTSQQSTVNSEQLTVSSEQLAVSSNQSPVSSLQSLNLSISQSPPTPPPGPTLPHTFYLGLSKVITGLY